MPEEEEDREAEELRDFSWAVWFAVGSFGCATVAVLIFGVLAAVYVSALSVGPDTFWDSWWPFLAVAAVAAAITTGLAFRWRTAHVVAMVVAGWILLAWMRAVVAGDEIASPG